MQAKNTIWTVGHSTHTLDKFVDLLKGANIGAVADVRSSPYSKFNEVFNRENLAQSLKERAIEYVFLGAELGARPKDRKCYVGGVAKYELIEKTAIFQSGVERLCEGVKKHNIALMCAEKEPLDCHRTVLVARHLMLLGLDVAHILSNGRVEKHQETEKRLMKLTREETSDMFEAFPSARAYEKRAEKIAFREARDGQ